MTENSNDKVIIKRRHRHRFMPWEITIYNENDEQLYYSTCYSSELDEKMEEATTFLLDRNTEQTK